MEKTNAKGHSHSGKGDELSTATHRVSFRTSIPELPVTRERSPWIPPPGCKLVHPGIARATLAADAQHPDGTTLNGWAAKHQHQTIVQQHCEFFDRDHDGIIWPLDTWVAFRSWKFFWPIAAFGTFIIHFALSYASNPSWIPDPFFRIWIANVHKNKHGSDSMSYDGEGRFKPQNFEDFFAKYDTDGKGGLTKWDIIRALKGQALAFDTFGVSAATLEWLATYLLLWPEDGIMRKDDIRRVFDGSIFEIKAEEYRRGRDGKRPAKFVQ